MLAHHVRAHTRRTVFGPTSVNAHTRNRSVGSHDLLTLLDLAKRSLDHGNDWRGEYDGFKLWIGAPGGSRTGQYDAQILKDGRAVEFRSRSFPALKKMFLKYSSTTGNSSNRAGGSSEESKITRADFRPRTRPGYYKRGVNVVRVDDVIPYRSDPNRPLGVADWWVYGTMTLTTPDRGGPSQGTQAASLQMKLYEFTSGNWKRVDAAKLSPSWKAFFARNP